MTKTRRWKIRGRLRRCLLVVLLLPLFLWLVLNLVFATSWGTGLVAKKIAARSGLPCSISRIAWTPWSGVTVEEILLSPPPGIPQSTVLRIESVKIDPSWSSLIRGKKRFERIEIQGVTGEVSLELVNELVGRGQLPPPPVPEPDPAKPVPILPGADDPDAPVVMVQPVDDASVVPSVKKARVVESGPASPDALSAGSVPSDPFEGTLVFKAVSLRFFSRQFPDLSAEVRDVEGELPIWGGRREGSVTFGDLEIAGRYHSQRVVLPLVYEDDFLSINDHPLKIFGLDLSLKAAVRFVRGLPYGIQFDLPPQRMDLSPIFPDGPPPVVIDGFRASARLQGHLEIPSSLTGESFVNFDRLVHRDPRDGSDSRFDSGSAHAQLSSAGLVVRDFRVLGDEEGLLGNGFLTSRGEAAAVVRIVASPDHADALENRVNRASADLDLKFEPLVTPDREYRDLHLELHSGTPVIDLGREKDWIPLLPLTRVVLGSREPRPPVFP